MDDDRLYSVDLHSGFVELTPRLRADLPGLLGDARDLEFREDVPVTEAVSIGRQALLLADALSLALIGLDGELSAPTRSMALARLDEMLADRDTYGYVRGVLYGCPPASKR